ncbi:YbhN family protein [Aquirhabdus sp.]|uniref:lysylphosphatidylglycerol synthase transmembrane domain-containing protein n=1 Tax=Aquirhabdus sp. TaxID=2824160 RepID=UPI00396D039E
MNESYLSGWRYGAVIMSVVLAAVGYLVFSLWGGWQAVSTAVGKVGLLGLSIVLLLSLLNYGLRFLRWQQYLRILGHPVPWRPNLSIYLAGFALTTTPGKVGEALRSILLKARGVPYPTSFAALFSERLSDLFAIVLLALSGLTLHASPVIVVGGILIILCTVTLTRKGLIEWFMQRIPEQRGKILGFIWHVLAVMLEARRCHRFGTLIAATLVSLSAWGAEAVGFYWILTWMGMDVSLSFACFVYALSILVGALIFIPGGLGGAEATMTILLVWKGMPHADAIAATVLIRLCTLWFAVGIGSIFLLSVKKDTSSQQLNSQAEVESY